MVVDEPIKRIMSQHLVIKLPHTLKAKSVVLPIESYDGRFVVVVAFFCSVTVPYERCMRYAHIGVER